MRRRHCLFALFVSLTVARAMAAEAPLPGCDAPPATTAGLKLPSPDPRVPSFHIVPAHIGERYTGCAFAWYADRDAMVLYRVARFEQGAMVASWSFIDDDIPALVCEYPARFWSGFRQIQNMPARQ